MRPPSRFVWLTLRELRRDIGPVDDLDVSEDGASGRLQYLLPHRPVRVAMLALAAIGAGLAVAAPLSGQRWLAASLIAVGALYATAVRLLLILRARDRTLELHGRFLAKLAQVRVAPLRRRPYAAALRFAQALAARHGSGEARDAIVAAGLRGIIPIAAGLWLASGAGPLAASLTGATLLAAAVAGGLAERDRLGAAFRASLAESSFVRRAGRFVAAWPTWRSAAAVDRLRRAIPIAAHERNARAAVRTLALFGLAVPAVPIAVLLSAGNMAPAALLGTMIAAVAAGQAGAAFGVQAMRLVQAHRRRPVADRLFASGDTPDRTIDRLKVLEVQQLAFRHPGATAPLFEGLDLTLRRGDVLALSSPSGSGKTTLLRILTGLAEPSAGRVLVNGDEARTTASRHRIAAVFQDEPVGAGTIRAAIAGGAPIGLDAAWAAAARVGVDTIIRALPMAMQTLVVEGPFPPSLLQPLLIARALAQQPDLLILDEALGSLPYECARTLLESLRHDGVMVIFASHDPRLVALADTVVALG